MIIFNYPKNSPLLKKYLEINNIISFSVRKNIFDGQPWGVWENTPNECGFPYNEFRTKKAAVAMAKLAAEYCNLPFVNS